MKNFVFCAVSIAANIRNKNTQESMKTSLNARPRRSVIVQILVSKDWFYWILYGLCTVLVRFWWFLVGCTLVYSGPISVIVMDTCFNHLLHALFLKCKTTLTFLLESLGFAISLQCFQRRRWWWPNCFTLNKQIFRLFHKHEISMLTLKNL